MLIKFYDYAEDLLPTALLSPCFVKPHDIEVPHMLAHH